MSRSRLVIRPALPSDAYALGRMGAALARAHHAFDAARFLLPNGIEEGYREWLAKESENDEALVLVAELEGEVVGYTYGVQRGRDWNKLLDRHAELVDLWVDEKARRSGVASGLVAAAFERFAQRNAGRVVLMAAYVNEAAQRLFQKHGFRPTMLEMTRET